MSHSPDPSSSSGLTLQLGPGLPNEARINLEVSPAHADELRECLEAEGLDVSSALAHSAKRWLDILSVSLPVAFGAGGAITVAITKFSEKNLGKKATVEIEGKIVVATEKMSGAETDRVVKAAIHLQEAISRSQAAAATPIENTPGAEGDGA
jgi:hypothetical protein